MNAGKLLGTLLFLRRILNIPSARTDGRPRTADRRSGFCFAAVGGQPSAVVLRFGWLLFILFLSACGGDDSPLQDEERIVFFGDSITEAGAEPGGYVTLVADSLARKYPDKNIEVIGAGISGNKVGDLQARLERDVLSHDPTTTVIYIGINDVWHWNSASGRGSTEEEFEAGLRTIIDTLQQAGSRVILCTPSVIGEKHDGTNEQDVMLDAYAEISRTLARDLGAETCDLRTDFIEYLSTHNTENLEQGILTTDGVHLNEAGNRFVADRMIAALEGEA